MLDKILEAFGRNGPLSLEADLRDAARPVLKNRDKDSAEILTTYRQDSGDVIEGFHEVLVRYAGSKKSGLVVYSRKAGEQASPLNPDGEIILVNASTRLGLSKTGKPPSLEIRVTHSLQRFDFFMRKYSPNEEYEPALDIVNLEDYTGEIAEIYALWFEKKSFRLGEVLALWDKEPPKGVDALKAFSILTLPNSEMLLRNDCEAHLLLKPGDAKFFEYVPKGAIVRVDQGYVGSVSLSPVEPQLSFGMNRFMQQ